MEVEETATAGLMLRNLYDLVWQALEPVEVVRGSGIMLPNLFLKPRDDFSDRLEVRKWKTEASGV